MLLLGLSGVGRRRGGVTVKMVEGRIKLIGMWGRGRKEKEVYICEGREGGWEEGKTSGSEYERLACLWKEAYEGRNSVRKWLCNSGGMCACIGRRLPVALSYGTLLTVLICLYISVSLLERKPLVVM